MLLHTAQRLFDGRHWYADAWLELAGDRVADWGNGVPPDGEIVGEHVCVMPALIDAHCHVAGSAEPVTPVQIADPYEPQRGCLALLHEAGVGAIRDLGNHPEMITNLTRLPDTAPVLIRSAGAVLDEPPAQVAHCRLVTDAEQVRQAVRVAAEEGASWVKTFANLRPELVAAAVQAADRFGLRVAHRPGRTDALTAARLGVDTVEHLALCAPPRNRQSPAHRPAAEVLRDWAEPGVLENLAGTLAELAERRVRLVPLVLATRRAAVLDDAVGEPRLERLLNIAPIHRHLIDMRGAGLNLGRRFARNYLGYEHLRGKARSTVEQGWTTLLAALRDAYEAGVVLLPGSDAVGISLVPGYALHEELGLWDRAGIPRDAILRAATGQAAALLGIAGPKGRDPWTAGVLAVRKDPTVATNLPGVFADVRFLVPPTTTAAVEQRRTPLERAQ
ncbi:hypothetical protein F0L68_28885 [Solihabitans fulvus]|uniref:Amidohydrolase family protein n=1 Tax=Solihabitans fulvus TaxID=1892852 RepID=A0A5B2WZA4_9PSEU|nr:hypothetical protein [Solihabitans fulvus]KAA2255237.1 hypothetical protein F0L68_28885 [Solihabitans fulvus]